MRVNPYSISTMICPECGHKMFVPRQKSNRRGKGHQKYLWCPYCQKIQNFDEIKEGEYIRDGNGDLIGG